MKNVVLNNILNNKNTKLIYKTHKKQFTNILHLLTMKLNMLLGPKNFNKKIIPSFDNLRDKDIYSYTGINPKWTYRNSIMWTPRFYLQKEISGEFLFQLKKFRKLEQWEDIHQVALTELILTEAIRDTTYEMALNYKVTPTLQNPFHGLIDILLYNNDSESNFYPVVPIVFPKYEKEEGVYYERYNNAQIIGIAYSLLQNYKINYSNNESDFYIKAIQTNGHEWSLLEIHEHHVKRTNIFKPTMYKTPNGYTPKIFDDYNHIRTVIGLIRYALNIEDNMVLKSSIYALDEKSEERLIQHKEAVSSLKSDSPDVIEGIGLNSNLLESESNKKENNRLENDDNNANKYIK